MPKLRSLIEVKQKELEDRVKQARDPVVANQLVKELLRWRCRNDLLFLCGITGNDKITQYSDYYRDFCDEVSLMNWKIVQLGMHPPNEEMLPVKDIEDELFLQRMYLCYRTYYKTTIITKVHSLQLLLNFSNIHIGLCHNKQLNSSDNLIAIKNYFLTTEIKNLFPELIPRGKEWGNMRGFSLATRTDWGRDEDNIEAMGVDTETTGRHYQVAKKNDLVTRASVGTEEQLRKTLDWDDRFNIGMFDDPQIKLQDYEGTRYHFADLYSIRKGDSKIRLTEISVVKDLGKFLAGDDDQISNPKRFTRQGILDLMADMWVFNCQMMLKPEDPARMQFKSEMISYFSAIPPECVFYLLVDPASARKKKSDYTVILVIAIDSQRRKYIVDGIRDRLDPKQRVDTALELAVRWTVKGCGWEAIGFQTTDCFYLEEERRKRQLYFSIEEIKSHTVAKEDRIRGLVPEYAQHLWLWPHKGACVKWSMFDRKNYDLTEELEYEFLQFPLCEHDDLLDAQTFFNRISTIKPEAIEEIGHTEMTFGEYSQEMEQKQKELMADPWKRLKIGERV